MKSVVSYPDRGPWGKSNWRGNCSGYVQRDLIEHFRPRTFVDVCEGSGTSRDVCREMGVDYKGFDLHGTADRGSTDFTSDYILGLLDAPADLVFSHPPYHNMVDYRKVGQFDKGASIGNDTSACTSVDEFLEKSMMMLLNQREATRAGGIYTTLIGDMRKKGFGFRSFQADFIKMMPTNELIANVIKMQHNCVSDNRNYAGSFIPIMHEYLIVWRKAEATMVQIAVAKAMELKAETSWTWSNLLRQVMMKHFKGNPASLSDIYSAVEEEAGDFLVKRPNWMAKVRQILQFEYHRVERGIWQAAAA